MGNRFLRKKHFVICNLQYNHQLTFGNFVIVYISFPEMQNVMLGANANELWAVVE